MSAMMRRVLGVTVAVLALGGGAALFTSQRAAQVSAARVQAQADVDAEFPRIAASLEELTQVVARAAERGANLEVIGEVLAQFTSQSDLAQVAKTLAGFEGEPFFEPYANVGPHAFFVGSTPLHCTEPALLPKLQQLVNTTTTAGTATALLSYGGAVWLVGVGRSKATSPQQQPMLFALAQKVTAEKLEVLATRHSAALLLVPAGKTSDALGAGNKDFVEALRGRLTSMKAASEPCCTQKELAPGVELLVYRDSAPRLHAVVAESSKSAIPIFGVAGLLALGALAFGFWPQPRKAEDHSELLRLKDQLQRLSLQINPAPSTERFAAAAGDDGLGSTQAAMPASRYEVVAPLGEGGMARVAVAVVRGAEGFKRTFVVKRLRPELSTNPEVVSQFIDEARLGASLVHSNIIPVFDFGRDAEGYYLAQEYILGRDVDVLITRSAERRGRPLDPAIVLYVAQETLKALGYAHTRTNDAGKAMGLVHRDVSPNNVMVSARGEVKLLDFGIVKSDDRATKTQAGVVKGNLFFMSPEQARALPVDARSDLFSMGMVLVSALSGQTLYSGSNVYDLMTRAAAGPTGADCEFVVGTCGALAPVILKALSVDPAQRYADADAFGAALAAVGPPASASELQALMEALFTTEFAEERQKFAVSA